MITERYVRCLLVTLVLLGLWASTLSAEQDEPLSETMVFDPASNRVMARDDPGRRIQDLSPDKVHVFFEAERMMATGSYVRVEWTTTTTGYADLVGPERLQVLSRPLSTRSAFVSGVGMASMLAGPHEDMIYHRVEITQPGAYHVWVRYQSAPTVPGPFVVDVRTRLEEKPLAQSTLNEKSAALDVRNARMVWGKALAFTVKEPGTYYICLRKSADDAAGPLVGARHVDCFLLTNDAEYAASGIDLLPSRDEVLARIQRLGLDGDQGIAVWSPQRFANLQATSWPDEAADVHPAIRKRLPLGVLDSALLAVTSLSDERQMLRVEVAGDDAVRNGVTMRVVAFRESRTYGWAPHALFRRDQVGVEPYHTAGLWATIDTRNLAAGVHRGRIEIRNAEMLLASVPVELELCDATIPRDKSLLVTTWDADVSKRYPTDQRAAMDERYLDMRLDYGYNVVRSTRPILPAEEARARGIVAHIFHAGRPKDDEGVEAHRNRVGAIIEDFEQDGYRQDELWYQSFDEPSDKTSELWARLAKAASEAYPDIKIWLNPGWQRWQSDDVFALYSQYADVWWPYAGNLAVPGRLDFLHNTGKPIGFYIERGWHGMNPDAPWAYFHRMTMMTAAYQIDGCSFWSSSSYRDDPWNDLDGPYAESAAYWPGNHGPISTIGWESWREGIHDVYTLRYLASQDKLDALEFGQRMLMAGSAEEVDRLRQCLYERVTGDLPDDRP